LKYRKLIFKPYHEALYNRGFGSSIKNWPKLYRCQTTPWRIPPNQSRDKEI